MDSSPDPVLGIDLGATKIEMVLMDHDLKVKGRVRTETPTSLGPERVRARILEKARDLLREAQAPPRAVGVGVAGQVEAGSGCVIFGPNLGWKNVPLGEWLREDLGSEVLVTNDVRAATYGEWKLGSGKGYENLVCLFLGTGIGGGIVSQSRLLTGFSNCAGELGHIIVRLDGPPCDCGARGCLEAMAGGKALARKAKALVNAYPASGRRIVEIAGGDPNGITMEAIVGAFREGNRLATLLVDEMKEALAAGLVSIVHAINPELVILGGGVLDGLPELVEEMERRVRGQAMEAASSKLKIVRSTLGSLAGAMGAGAMALDKLLAHHLEEGK
jgi:glucokinase